MMQQRRRWDREWCEIIGVSERNYDKFANFTEVCRGWNKTKYSNTTLIEIKVK